MIILSCVLFIPFLIFGTDNKKIIYRRHIAIIAFGIQILSSTVQYGYFFSDNIYQTKFVLSLATLTTTRIFDIYQRKIEINIEKDGENRLKDQKDQKTEKSEENIKQPK